MREIKKTQIKRKILAIGILVALVTSITVVAIVVTDTTDADVKSTPPNVTMCNVDGSKINGAEKMIWCDSPPTGCGKVPANTENWNCGTASLHFDDLSGGTIIHWLRATNNGDTAVEGYLVYKVTCDVGFSNDVDDNIPDDITGVSGCIYDWNSGVKRCIPFSSFSAFLALDDSNGYCYDGTGLGTFYVWSGTYLYPSSSNGNQYYVETDITFHDCASGTYTIHTSIVADEPVPIKSSTMIFRGTGNPSTGTHTYAMIDESISGNPGDGIAGFDVCARSGAIAMYDKAGSGQDYAHGPVTNYDAYTTAGGWGTWYDPDCADWYNYQLRIDGNNWYVEYNANVGIDGTLTGATAPPMSGTLNTGHTYATEADVGAYYSGMGTPESPGYAVQGGITPDNPWTTGDGTQSWDMDWSWGSEYVPLQYPGFDVTVTSDSSTPIVYTITLTPAP